MKVKAPCQNCSMRYVNEKDGKVFSCHSECPRYRQFKEELAKVALQKKVFLAQFTEQYVEHQTQVVKALRKKQRRFYV